MYLARQQGDAIILVIPNVIIFREHGIKGAFEKKSGQ